MKLVLIPCLCVGLTASSRAGEAWAEALRVMPLPAEVVLNRDNSVEVLLDAFRSNRVVKALLVLPGVADDFYLINRSAPALALRATNLFEAVRALTNATAIRATFREPFLLLHVRRDFLEPACAADTRAAARELKTHRRLPRVRHSDAHWENIQPALEKALQRPIRPEAASADSWHFNRHNLAGWGLSDWEVLSALSLTGGTRVSVQKRAIVFQRRDTP